MKPHEVLGRLSTVTEEAGVPSLVKVRMTYCSFLCRSSVCLGTAFGG